MNNGFRIPTFLAFLLVGGVIAILGVFSDDARILLGRAAQPSSTIPREVEIYNVTDTTAVIFWESKDVVANTVRVPTTNSTFYDVRDTDSIPKAYKLHMYLLNNLPPQKPTSFEIKSGNQIVYKGTVTTGPALSNIPQALPLYGTVPKEITSPQVFIKARINDQVTSMAFSSTPNSWSIPIAALRTTDTKNFYCATNTCADDTPIVLTFLTEEQRVEKTETFASARPFIVEELTDTDEDVLASTSATLSPTITQIANSRVATPTGKMQKTTITPTKTSESKTVLPLAETQKKTVLGTTTEEITIISPTEGQALSFNKPLIRGTGINGRDVSISLSGQITQIGKTKVTDKNSWQWSPSYPLSPGKYNLTISTSDKNNRKVNKTISFFVLKSGESVLSASTPSATLIPFPTDTPTPTVPIDIPTATPTMFVTAGPEVSLFFIGGGTLLLLFAFALL